jgi:hypothetical protein
VDLETAQRIERLEAQVAMLIHHLGLNGREGFLPPPPYLPAPGAPTAFEPQDAVAGMSDIPGNPRLPPAFFEAMAANKKIQAIKIYREHTGVGLREAKDYVDSLDPDYRKRR